MTKEIEHKFLVKDSEKENLLRILPNHFEDLVQGYFQKSGSVVFRVRLVSKKQAFLTIKNKFASIIRDEYEYEIPYNDGVELLKLTENIIHKKRYKIPYEKSNSLCWEIDFYDSGLTVGEIEVDNERFMPVLPNWIEKNISNVEEYSNFNLAKNSGNKKIIL